MRPRGRGEQRSGRATGLAARGDLAGLKQRLAAVIEPVAAEAGFDLERLRVNRIGRRHSVQVVIDGDHGVGLDAIAEVSRAVSAALDTAEESGAAVVPGEYVLEVTSPGVDRPLTEPRHWRRNVGRLVSVTVPPGEAVTGRIEAATAEAVVLVVADAARELRYEQLGPGQVQVELRPAGQDETEDDDGEGDRG